MKKLCGLIFASALAVALLCAQTTGVANADEARQLTAPSNVVLTLSGEDYAVTWARVADNNGYTVKIDGTEYSVDKNTETLNVNTIMQSGVVYSVSVKAEAVDDANDSAYSTAVDIVKRAKLSAPINLAVNENVLSWDAVSGATNYRVIINGVLVASNLATNSLDLGAKLFSTGEYQIKVRAEGNADTQYNSNYSAIMNYEYKKVMATPENFTVTATADGVYAGWDSVTYADGYEVVIDDGTPIAVDGNSVEISTFLTSVKDYSVKVRATDNGNYLASDYATSSYAKTAKIATPELTLNGTVLSWTKPTGANYFAIKIGADLYDGEYSLTSLDIATALAEKAEGEYVIYVQAIKNGNYDASDIASVSYVKQSKLSTPELAISGTVLSWDSVANAVNYTVYVDDTLVSATYASTSFDFADYLGEAGDYVISVFANANGHYTKSDTASKTYTLSVQLGTTDVSADGQVIKWTAVLGASKYAVTVDGEKVAETTALEYDLAEYLTENKAYTIGVYAIGYDSYTSATASTVSLTGVAPSVAMKTYDASQCGITKYEDMIIYLDGVQTEYTIVSGNLTIPASAQKLIMVPDEITDGTRLFEEVNLTAITEYDGKYIIMAESATIVSCENAGTINGLNTAECSAYEQGEYFYVYYLESVGGLVPTEVA